MKFITKLLPFVLIGMLSCTGGQVKTDLENTKAELEKTKQELKNCRERWVEERKNSPEQRFLIAKKLFDDGNYTESRKKYEQIISKFPNTDYAKTASKELAGMDKEINRLESEALKQKAEDERKKALGFKILKP